MLLLNKNTSSFYWEYVDLQLNLAECNVCHLRLLPKIYLLMPLRIRVNCGLLEKVNGVRYRLHCTVLVIINEIARRTVFKQATEAKAKGYIPPLGSFNRQICNTTGIAYK